MHEHSGPADVRASVGADETTIAAARRIAAEAESFDGTPPISDQALLEAAQGRRTLVLFSEPDADGESEPAPVAAGIVGEDEIDLVVTPDARGRGIGRTALTALLSRPEAGPGALRSWAHGDNPAAEALLTGAGFTPVRSLFRMALDPALLPDQATDPSALEAPEGFELLAFDPEHAERDAAAWVSANADAFSDHPQQGRITVDDFNLMRAEPWFDPADLLLLWKTPVEDDAELAGSTWVKTVRAEGHVETELYAVGVRPAFGGRGIGRFLLAATLARMAQHAPERVTLYVDGENTRAVELYERAGFTIDSRSRQWERPAQWSPGARMEA
ncbi:mycothiol synthase [Leucobacter sp. CSA2]|uniref:Mycothiol synthase n=1 Tax=Leucobacter edaphi TaxID=2796472 RepID=A0A934UW33_9MICO|nr:mycothiol synthase [Leucobacter edaphi]MBK0420545.1 mycothiol synthase [Leucobacter edaphi]